MRQIPPRGRVRVVSCLALLMLLLAVPPALAYSQTPNLGPPSQSPSGEEPWPWSATGIILPMFTKNLTTELPQIIQAKTAHPSVPMLAVINPENGPGPLFNSSIADAIASLRAAGIVVIGYVPTSWGNRPVASVESDVLTFHDWYNVSGIYFDEMYNMEFSFLVGAFVPTYYSILTAYVKSVGMTEVFGNSGAEIPYYFIGSVDTIGCFENSHLPTLSQLGGWHGAFNKSNFAFFAYNVTSVDPYYLAAASNYVGYLYVTDGVRPWPYSGLPSYFDRLVSLMDSMTTLTVQTAAPNGTLVSRGLNVTVTQPDGTTTSAYAPSIFSVIKGTAVRVSVKDSGGYVFDHWGDGGTNRTRVVNATVPTRLVAYSRTAVSNTSRVTVHTLLTDGIPVTGLWTTAAVDGKIVAAGYTPFSFMATKGVTYSLSVYSYRDYALSYWANVTAGTKATITPTADVLLNAYVVNGTAS